MGQIEPGDREEMLLAGILNGDTETNIEPGSRKEMLLKAILEQGSGGGKKYQHNLHIRTTIIGGKAYLTFSIVNDSNTSLDYDAIAALLKTSGFSSTSLLCTASGQFKISGEVSSLYGVYSSNGTSVNAYYVEASGTASYSLDKQGAEISDVVIEI